MVASDDILYVGTGGMPRFGAGGAGGGGASGQPTPGRRQGCGSGDITGSHDAAAWKLPQGGPGMASPLLYDGHLYVLDQRGGLLSCYDAKTGKQVYRRAGRRTRFHVLALGLWRQGLLPGRRWADGGGAGRP